MKLFLVHCGFYDDSVGGGLFEHHMNFFVVSIDFTSARLKAKELPEFKLKRMHVDGIQEIEAVMGHRLKLIEDIQLGHATVVQNYKHRDLAPSDKTIL